MRWTVPALVWLSCLVACSPVVIVQSPPQSSGPVADPSLHPGEAPPVAAVVVTAELVKRQSRQPGRDGGDLADAVALSPGEIVVDGDLIALHVDLDHEAYIYVLYLRADGTVHDKFPVGAAAAARGSQRLPPQRWWTIDRTSGREGFVVLAAARPLTQPERRALAAAWQATVTGSGAPSKPRPAVKRVKPRRRDMASESDRGPEVDGIVAWPDPDGIISTVFLIDHE